MFASRLLSFSRAPLNQVTRRSFFVSTKPTPNPDRFPILELTLISSVQFFPEGVKVMEKGTVDFGDAFSARKSPLGTAYSLLYLNSTAKQLFQQEGVKKVFLGPDFITITKSEESEVWTRVSAELLI